MNIGTITKVLLFCTLALCVGIAIGLATDMEDEEKEGGVEYHTHEEYVNKTGDTLMGDIHAPNLYASGVIYGNGSGLTDLNADTLDGLYPAEFAKTTHCHDTMYYPRSEMEANYLNLSGGTLTGDLYLRSLYASGVINGDGSGLTKLNASRLNTGTIDSMWLPSNIDADTLDGLDSSSFAIAVHSHDEYYYLKSEMDANFLRLNGGTLTGDLYVPNLYSSGAINGDGIGLTNLNASNIAVGTIDSARLPANIDADTLDGKNYNSTEIKPFGSWETKNFDTVYQATTDGFVVAFVYTDINDVATNVMGYTDSNNPPTTLIAVSGESGNTVQNDPDDSYSITFPVKKNDYYRVTADNEKGTSMVYWMPMGI